MLPVLLTLTKIYPRNQEDTPVQYSFYIQIVFKTKTRICIQTILRSYFKWTEFGKFCYNFQHFITVG